MHYYADEVRASNYNEARAKREINEPKNKNSMKIKIKRSKKTFANANTKKSSRIRVLLCKT